MTTPVVEAGIADVVVLISARAEWSAAREVLAPAVVERTPFGESFVAEVASAAARRAVVFVHGGWGKIAAAASTQYALDRWAPTLLVNLGTCGGFLGAIQRAEVVLAERTLVYDIVEQMGDPDAALAHYATTLDLSWLGQPYPARVHRGLLVSGDRDIVADELPRLRRIPGACAADWESGAIAYVAARNGVRCLILRGVSDLVGEAGGEAYGDGGRLFAEAARSIMRALLDTLPAWIDLAVPIRSG